MVMMRTANSYQDVLSMPLSVFIATIKQIRITDLSENPDWRKAYLEQRAQELIEKRKPALAKKLDIQGVQGLIESLSSPSQTQQSMNEN